MRSRSLSKLALALVLSIFLAAPALHAARLGDVNGDGEVDLLDAILALRVVANLQEEPSLHLSGDVNGDGRIGVEEAIYALQTEARLRNYPTLNPIGSKSVFEGQTLSFSISASDPEGDELTFSALNLPAGSAFDPGSQTFSWTVLSPQNLTYEITFAATDTQGYSDFETVTIWINFYAPVYFPLQEENWWDYIEEGSGEVSRTIVSGTKNIGGTDTFAVQYPARDKEYYTSDENGIRLFGVYTADTGDIIFTPPLLLVPNNAGIGSPEHVSSSSCNILGTLIDITARTRLLALEDVITQNRELNDCIKASVDFVYTDAEKGDTLIEQQTHYWFYKGVGVVKQIDSAGFLIITESFVNGENDIY